MDAAFCPTHASHFYGTISGPDPFRAQFLIKFYMSYKLQCTWGWTTIIIKHGYGYFAGEPDLSAFRPDNLAKVAKDGHTELIL